MLLAISTCEFLILLTRRRIFEMGIPLQKWKWYFKTIVGIMCLLSDQSSATCWRMQPCSAPSDILYDIFARNLLHSCFLKSKASVDFTWLRVTFPSSDLLLPLESSVSLMLVRIMIRKNLVRCKKITYVCKFC